MIITEQILHSVFRYRTEAYLGKTGLDAMLEIFYIVQELINDPNLCKKLDSLPKAEKKELMQYTNYIKYYNQIALLKDMMKKDTKNKELYINKAMKICKKIPMIDIKLFRLKFLLSVDTDLMSVSPRRHMISFHAAPDSYKKDRDIGLQYNEDELLNE